MPHARPRRTSDGERRGPVYTVTVHIVTKSEDAEDVQETTFVDHAYRANLSDCIGDVTARAARAQAGAVV
jgi:hypothetical protein